MVEVFKNRWDTLSGGKPIVASANLFEGVSQAALMEVWNEFARWKRWVMPTLAEEKRLFSTEVNYMTVWVIDDKVCFTMMYPADY